MNMMKVKTGIKAGMINPASKNCTDMGGQWSAVDIPNCGGEVGLCLLPSGQICEEWALFRGECQPDISPPLTR